MKLFLHTALFVLMTTGLSAQTIFQKTYSSDRYDYGRSVVQTYDGGFAIVGATSSWGGGTTDVYLIKTNEDGDFLWSQTYGGNNVDWGYDILELPDSSLFITGYTNSEGEGGYDGYFIRTDSMGALMWDTTYGGTDWDFTYAAHLAPDTTIMVVGETYSSGAGNGDAWLIRLTRDGEVLWDSTYGGAAHDEFRDIDTVHSGGYVLTGGTNSFGAGDEDLYLVHVNENGTIAMDTFLGGTGEDFGRAVYQSADSMYVLCGQNGTDTGEPQMWSIKYNHAADSIEWQKITGGAEPDFGKTALQYYWAGGMIFAGQTESFGFGAPGDIRKTYRTPSGIYIGGSTIGDLGLDEVEMSITTRDSGFVFVGSTDSYGVTYSAVYLIKFDRNCNTTLLPDAEIDVNDIHEMEELTSTALYPNPVSTGGTLYAGELFGQGAAHELIWYDLTGRELERQEVHSAEIELSNSLPVGPVIYHFIRDDMLINQGRLLILR